MQRAAAPDNENATAASRSRQPGGGHERIEHNADDAPARRQAPCTPRPTAAEREPPMRLPQAEVAVWWQKAGATCFAGVPARSSLPRSRAVPAKARRNALGFAGTVTS